MRSTGRSRTWAHGRAPNPLANTSIMCAAHVGIAHGPWESNPSTSIHEHPGHRTGRDRSWAHARAPYPQAFTSILRAAIVGKADGPMGEHPTHEHPRASCALHRQGSLMAPWESTPSTSIHEHPVRCTGRNRSWAHGRAPHSRASSSILCTAQVGIAHGHMGEHPTHEHPGTSCALHR